METLDKLPEGVQPQISVEELLLCEDIIRADERVQKLAKEVGKSAEFVVNPCDVSDCIIHCIGVEPHQLCADGWAIGEYFVITEAQDTEIIIQATTTGSL